MAKKDALQNFLFQHGLLKKKSQVLSFIERYKNEELLFNELLVELIEEFNVDIRDFFDFANDLGAALDGEDEEQQQDAEEVSFSSVEELMSHLKEEFLKKNKDLHKRLESAVISYMRGVRNELLLFDQLTKGKKVGGVDLSPGEANKIINTVSKYLQKHPEEKVEKETSRTSPKVFEDMDIDTAQEKPAPKHEFYSGNHQKPENLENFFEHIGLHRDQLREYKELQPPPPSTEVRYELSEHEESKEVEKTNDVSKKEEVTDKDVSIDDLFEDTATEKEGKPDNNIKTSDDMSSVRKKPALDMRKKQQEVPQQIKKMVDHDVAEKQAQSSLQGSQKTQPPQPPRTSRPASQRPKLDDVKYEPRLVTPTDELQDLTVKDFRRLSDDPHEAADKIIQKLELLGQDSLLKQDEGISSLRKSELYRRYSEVLNKSLLEGKSFTQSVQELGTLSKEEFDALMELNRKIKV